MADTKNTTKTNEPLDGELQDNIAVDVNEEEFDSLTFSDGVIEKVIGLALKEVPSVLGMKGGWVNRIQDAFGQSAMSKGVTIDTTDEGSLIVNVSVIIKFGAYAPDVFESVKASIVDAMDRMTGLEVAGVNLNIADVLTEEEALSLAKSNQARLEAGEDVDEEPIVEDPDTTSSDGAKE